MDYQESNFIPFSRPLIGEEEERAVLEVMRSGWLTTGKVTASFEKEFAAFLGTDYAIAVNSASSGLTLAMEACGVRDRCIITTPYTFTSTASSARHLNAEVVYADTAKDSYNINPAEIEKKLKENGAVRAIVPVHIAGLPCPMDEIQEIARKYDVYVIEDAAHAFPSKIDSGIGGSSGTFGSHYAGTIGDAGVFSFYATKTITTGEGGMIATNNEELASRMRLMSMHGIDRPVWDRYTSKKASWEYDVVEAGYKCNMPDILAAIGREQLKRAEELFRQRTEIAGMYNEAFKQYGFLRIPPDGPGNAWHLYLLRIVPEKLNIQRNEFSALLQERGIGTSMHFIPHFRLSYWKNRYSLNHEDFPHAERQFQSTISLPLCPGMTEEMVQKVIDTVIQTGKEHYGRP
ncbi:MAG: DegT/DnrJ/EryC1/StrS aminotransferase family protein [Spirochaetaceae bacterium]|jgi:dTDP-4-amino-4,6-dideoxygalactose transaminase|nr:DegT/DnrJ/EryC1/StrS aminotransferase family protein [Spirochaetaceae bacterium]